MQKFLGLGFAFVALLSACGGNDDRVAELEAQLAELTAQQATTTSLAPIETEESETLAVPNVTGLDKSQAITILREVGLQGEIEAIETSDFLEGQVMLQIPRADTEATSGDTIVLRVATPAAPPMHDLSVELWVRDSLYTNLGGGECEYQPAGATVGQSFRVVGPDGVALGAASVTAGEVKDDEESSTGKSCLFEFTFGDLPEVATYSIATATAVWPAASLSELKGRNWRWTWKFDRS